MYPTKQTPALQQQPAIIALQPRARRSALLFRARVVALSAALVQHPRARARAQVKLYEARALTRRLIVGRSAMLIVTRQFAVLRGWMLSCQTPRCGARVCHCLIRLGGGASARHSGARVNGWADFFACVAVFHYGALVFEHLHIIVDLLDLVSSLWRVYLDWK